MSRSSGSRALNPHEGAVATGSSLRRQPRVSRVTPRVIGDTQAIPSHPSTQDSHGTAQSYFFQFTQLIGGFIGASRGVPQMAVPAGDRIHEWVDEDEQGPIPGSYPISLRRGNRHASVEGRRRSPDNASSVVIRQSSPAVRNSSPGWAVVQSHVTITLSSANTAQPSVEECRLSSPAPPVARSHTRRHASPRLEDRPSSQERLMSIRASVDAQGRLTPEDTELSRKPAPQEAARLVGDTSTPDEGTSRPGRAHRLSLLRLLPKANSNKPSNPSPDVPHSNVSPAVSRGALRNPDTPRRKNKRQVKFVEPPRVKLISPAPPVEDLPPAEDTALADFPPIPFADPVPSASARSVSSISGPSNQQLNAGAVEESPVPPSPWTPTMPLPRDVEYDSDQSDESEAASLRSRGRSTPYILAIRPRELDDEFYEEKGEERNLNTRAPNAAEPEWTMPVARPHPEVPVRGRSATPGATSSSVRTTPYTPSVDVLPTVCATTRRSRVATSHEEAHYAPTRPHLRTCVRLQKSPSVVLYMSVGLGLPNARGDTKFDHPYCQSWTEGRVLFHHYAASWLGIERVAFEIEECVFGRVSNIDDMAVYLMGMARKEFPRCRRFEVRIIPRD